jgi:hypothetical protein
VLKVREDHTEISHFSYLFQSLGENVPKTDHHDDKVNDIIWVVLRMIQPNLAPDICFVLHSRTSASQRAPINEAMSHHFVSIVLFTVTLTLVWAVV